MTSWLGVVSSNQSYSAFKRKLHLVKSSTALQAFPRAPILAKIAKSWLKKSILNQNILKKKKPCQVLKSLILIIQLILLDEFCMSSLSSPFGPLLRSQIDILGQHFTKFRAKLPNTCHGRLPHCTNEKSTPPLSSFGICAGFLFVFLLAFLPQCAHPPTHSLQDILEDKPQICCDKSLSSNRWKCDLKSWLVEANFASNDWFGWDAQVSKSGINLEKWARP